MKRYSALVSSVLTGLVVMVIAAFAAAPGVINQYNALCNPDFPTRCAEPAADGSLPVTTTIGGTVTVVGASTAADDGALTAALKTWSILAGFDGATTDLIRSGDVNNVAAATGYLDALTVGRYNATRPTLTDTRFNALQVDLRGNLATSVCTGDGSACAQTIDDTSDNVAASGTFRDLFVASIPRLFDGTAFDRVRSVNSGQADGTGTMAVHDAPTSDADGGIAGVVSTAVETGHVIKASAGNLYGFSCTAGAAGGRCLVHNSTTVPSAGAVTPVDCVIVAANSTVGVRYDPPLVLGTGISISFSTATTCFTQTDSATAFISGQAK